LSFSRILMTLWNVGRSGPLDVQELTIFVGTENAYLRAWFRSQKTQTIPVCMSYQKFACYEITHNRFGSSIDAW
jgi:hypothetical protein